MRDKNNVLVTFVKMAKNRMFPLYLSVSNSKCLKANGEDESTLWHLRYGHLNFEALKIPKEKNMMSILPKIDRPNKRCEVCIMGKQQRKSFPSKVSKRASQHLELVHLNVCKPITPTTIGGNRYILAFTNEF